MLYRVSFEFRLTRRVPWTGDGAAFYSHVEVVRAHVAAHRRVAGVHAITDLAESLLTFDFLIEAQRHEHASREALWTTRRAIEYAGARHFGLEATRNGLPGTTGASPGLETPVWHYRRMLIDVAA